MLLPKFKYSIKYNKNDIAFIAIIFFTFFIPRIISLGSDIYNVDAHLWFERSQNFIKYFLNGDFSNTYQRYHPGVTVMITSGISIELYKWIYSFVYHYNPVNYPQQFVKVLFVAKFPIVFLISILSTYSAFLIYKIIGNKTWVYLFVIILSFEPFFLGISKFLHLTALTSVLSFSSFISLLYYYTIKNDYVNNRTKLKEHKSKLNNIVFFILSAILFGLALLTKINSLIATAPIVLVIFYYNISSANKLKFSVKRSLFELSCFIFISLLIFIILFPAMWVNPVETIARILNDGIINTAFKNSPDDSVTKVRYIFYPEITILRTSPIYILGILSTLIYVIKKLLKGTYSTNILKLIRDNNILVMMIIYTLAIIIVISIPLKLKDRYLIMFFPSLTFIITYGLYKLYSIGNYSKYILIVLIIVNYSFIAYRYHPTYSAYYNDIFGGPAILQNYMNIFNRGEFYPQVAFYLNNTLDNPASTNVVISERFKFSSFKSYFYGKTYMNPKFLPNGSNVDYIILRPRNDLSFEQIPYNNCSLIKKFGVRKPLEFNQLFLYKCNNLDNTYKDFHN